MSTLDSSIIFVYLGLMVVIGFYANYRHQGVEDYYVAGRRLGPFSIACLQGVFVIEPLWPGLTVSLVTFVMMTLLASGKRQTTPFPAKR